MAVIPEMCGKVERITALNGNPHHTEVRLVDVQWFDAHREDLTVVTQLKREELPFKVGDWIKVWAFAIPEPGVFEAEGFKRSGPWH